MKKLKIIGLSLSSCYFRIEWTCFFFLITSQIWPSNGSILSPKNTWAFSLAEDVQLSSWAWAWASITITGQTKSILVGAELNCCWSRPLHATHLSSLIIYAAWQLVVKSIFSILDWNSWRPLAVLVSARGKRMETRILFYCSDFILVLLSPVFRVLSYCSK